MMATKLFGNRIEPACAYCRFGSSSAGGTMILCGKYGVVAPYYSCKKYRYDPLKRVPAPIASLPEYDSSEFEL